MLQDDLDVRLRLLSKWNGKPSKKGTGFEQPLTAHQHWHIDFSYINISGTFYYLCSILLGGMVRPCFLLEGRRPVLEELFLPAVEDRGLQAQLLAELGGWLRD